MRGLYRFPGLPIDLGLAGKFRSSCLPRIRGKQNVRHKSFLYPGCKIYLKTEGGREAVPEMSGQERRPPALGRAE
jgi:hypothetical protein